jgi:hypothetical protein
VKEIEEVKEVKKITGVMAHRRPGSTDPLPPSLRATRFQLPLGADMPITITLLPSNSDGSGSNLFYAIGTLAFSGNYTTGGDTLDFSKVADKLPSLQIIQVFADSQNGNSGYYVPISGSALNNWKLKAFTGGGTEISSGAYPSSVTSDVVQVTITARKLQ